MRTTRNRSAEILMKFNSVIDAMGKLRRSMRGLHGEASAVAKATVAVETLESRLEELKQEACLHFGWEEE